MRTVLPYVTIVCLVTLHPRPAVAQVDQQRAREYFNEVRALCERDGGRLWGVSVCGPMIIGDVRTQTFATSQPAPDAARPRLIGLVNAPVQWGGTIWGAYIWDFVVKSTPRHRNELLLHELFHRVQPQLGLAVPATANEHLDAPDARYRLRLEWRALARALQDSGEPRLAAVRDALAFRQARREASPGSAESERRAEIGEGLAQYTGTVLAAPSADEAIASALEQFAAAEKQDSFVRTFAYTSGTAYGLLLDASSDDWRRRLRQTDDLASLVMKALDVQPVSDAASAASRYGGAALRAEEERRDQQRRERVAALRRRFVDGPVLVIPGGGRGSFDARGAVVIPDVGTVYFGPYRFSAACDTLEADKGVLVASDGGARRVSAPVRQDDMTFSGDGWTFKAAPGCVVREGERPGDYVVVRQQI